MENVRKVQKMHRKNQGAFSNEATPPTTDFDKLFDIDDLVIDQKHLVKNFGPWCCGFYHTSYQKHTSLRSQI